ncbi:PASTA domain-containing protein [Nocardia stercoris]|uniref:PASTA domain-containing protein n=1 Tax=Nocardia stercoris TaxID=2483361 RepID=UPI00131A2988|nr:PASTA domain-containing protein [Nocardia stercoris]
MIIATTSVQATTATAAAVTVPEVRGERPVKAQQILEAAGLKGEFKSANPGAVAGSIPNRGPGGGECVVATTDPAVGAKVAPGTVVTMTSSEPGSMAHPGHPC